MNLLSKFKFSCVTTLLSVSIAFSVCAQSQYGWRGPNRDGIYQETGLLKAWPADGPKLLWETLDAGKGYSSPVFVGSNFYITGMNEAEDAEIFSSYTLDGKKVYQTTYGKPWNKNYPETRTTPAIVGNKAYVISGAGEIVCINITDGKIIWTVDGATKFDRKTGAWGTSECPLVFDNKVLFHPGGDKAAMVALNAETGETVWQSRPLGDICNYASPLLISYNGKKQIVGFTGKNVIGVNPENGTIMWSFSDWGLALLAKGWEKISPNMPLYKDGKLFICQGYDIGSFMLELNSDLTGVSLKWRNADLDTHLGGFVLIDGVVYGSNWVNNNQGGWAAVDWNTGKTLYNETWTGCSKGATVSADGMLYCYEERRGMVGLVRPNKEKFDLVSSFRITKGEGPHWAHPVINNGVLYIRHGNAIMAFSVK